MKFITKVLIISILVEKREEPEGDYDDQANTIFGAFWGGKCLTSEMGCLSTVSDCVDYRCSPKLFVWVLVGLIPAICIGGCLLCCFCGCCSWMIALCCACCACCGDDSEEDYYWSVRLRSPRRDETSRLFSSKTSSETSKLASSKTSGETSELASSKTSAEPSKLGGER